MFSSTNSINPFPVALSSPYNVTDNSNNINDISNLPFQNLPTIPLLPQNPPITTQTELDMVSKQDILALNGDYHHHHHHHHQHISPSGSLLRRVKRPVKKDRHSKIYTAQGLRDRRVRLSIEIARKFFDLQDMLGFDKASETLEWLLTNSTKAIKELAEKGCTAKGRNFSSTSTSCEVVSDNGEHGLIVSKTESSSSDKKMKQLKNFSAVNLLVKESRAKARARARERTIAKKRNHHDLNNHLHIMNQSSSLLTQHEKSGSYPLNMAPSLKRPVLDHEGDEEPKGNIIKESTVIKRKMKQSATMGYQQNLVMLQEDNNITTSSYLLNLGQNWDIGNAIARPNLYGITNMNLSTELQLYGKLWEAENNQCQP